MTEKWANIEDFPGYKINEYGDVFNTYSGLELTSSPNKEGVLSVGLRIDGKGKTCRRSVAVLVSNTFLPKPTRYDFNTPIHLDGDRSNCHVDNLMWRPRWFAIKYHQNMLSENNTLWNKVFENIDTGERFNHPRECAMKYGLLENEIVVSIWSQRDTLVYPPGFKFRFI